MLHTTSPDPADPARERLARRINARLAAGQPAMPVDLHAEGFTAAQIAHHYTPACSLAAGRRRPRPGKPRAALPDLGLGLLAATVALAIGGALTLLAGWPV
jgi:hypothetical protein